MKTMVAFVTLLVLAGGASAQTATSAQSPDGATPIPSVGNGIGNGVVKHQGSPSVDDGQANGIVKSKSSPSVGNGIGNGVVKSSTTQQ